MTPNNPTSSTPPSSARPLPFAYEDRSQAGYRRAVQEILAARAWVARRRAQGLQPC